MTPSPTTTAADSLADISARLDRIDDRAEQMETRIRQDIADLRQDFRADIGDLRQDFRADRAAARRDIRWMIGIVATGLIAVLARIWT